MPLYNTENNCVLSIRRNYEKVLTWNHVSYTKGVEVCIGKDNQQSHHADEAVIVEWNWNIILHNEKNP